MTAIDAIQLASVVILLVLLHALICAGLFRMVEPFRREMAVRGERLLADPRLTSEQKQFISTTMDLSFSGWVMPILAFVIPPLFIFTLIRSTIDRIKGKPRRSLFASLDEESKGHARFVALTFFLSAASLSPISALVVVLEIWVTSLTPFHWPGNFFVGLLSAWQKWHPRWLAFHS